MNTSSTITIVSGNQGPGDPVEVNGAYITSFAFTNTTPVSIDYSTDTGATFTALAAGSAVTLAESDPDKYRFRRTDAGASAAYLITAAVVIANPLSSTYSGDAVATVAASDSAAAAAATATAIAAAIPAAAPAGGVGAAAGGWDTAANRDAAIVTINDLRTHAVEMDLDYEALLVDVADIRTKYAAVVTLANENKTKLNALLAALRENKVINT